MIGDAVLQRPDSIVDIGVTNNANSYTLKPLYCSLVHCVLKKTSTIRSSPKAILIGGIESAEKSLAIRSEEYIPEYWEFEDPLLERQIKANLLWVTADLMFMSKMISESIDLPNILAHIIVNTRINYKRRDNLINLSTQRTNSHRSLTSIHLHRSIRCNACK